MYASSLGEGACLTRVDQKLSLLLGMSLPMMLLASPGCGPMNTAPPALSTVGGACSTPAANLSATGSAVSFSKNGNFVVHSTPKSSQAKAGSNEYLLRLAQGLDMRPVSKDAVVTVQCLRISSKTQSKYPAKTPATVQKLEDGSFLITATFDKPGNWELDFHLTDGTLQDDHVVSITF